MKALRRHWPVLLLLLISLLYLTFSFRLAYRRYYNFDYNKFDLGNMAQMVWNTSRGRIMEVTDQFGTNMPRWGMSHVDPILILFAPLFWIYAHPLVLVLVQHILLVSAVFPLYWLSQQFLKAAGGRTFLRQKSERSVPSQPPPLIRELAPLAIPLTYLAYPALGYTLVWSEFHGLSVVAPLFIWTVWWLEKHNFLIDQPRPRHLVYWLLFALMLAGKEEVGAMLAIGGILLWFKNKKLGAISFAVGSAWTLICFLIIIPAYAPLREESILNFIEANQFQGLQPEKVIGGNFFLRRYSPLGSSYGEVLLSPLTKPRAFWGALVGEKNRNLFTLNHLLGPLGYIFALSPLLLITLPDVLISALSKDAIFEITNHRISFVTAVVFISLLYALKFIKKRLPDPKFRWLEWIPWGILVLTIGFSLQLDNPLFIGGASLIKHKLLSPILAGESSHPGTYTIGDIRPSHIPVVRDDHCEEDVWKIIQERNPQIYTGPDYLGALASLREVNALFPARLTDADLIVADFFDDKALEPFTIEFLGHNRQALSQRLAQRDLEWVYSCGRMSIFVRANREKIRPDEFTYQLEGIKSTGGYTAQNLLLGTVGVIRSELPPEILPGQEAVVQVFGYKHESPQADRDVTWLTFEHSSGYVFKALNIASSFGENNLWILPDHTLYQENIRVLLPHRVPEGEYQVFYAYGSQSATEEVYLGKVRVRWPALGGLEVGGLALQ